MQIARIRGINRCTQIAPVFVLFRILGMCIFGVDLYTLSFYI